MCCCEKLKKKKELGKILCKNFHVVTQLQHQQHDSVRGARRERDSNESKRVNSSVIARSNRRWNAHCTIPQQTATGRFKSSHKIAVILLIQIIPELHSLRFRIPSHFQSRGEVEIGNFVCWWDGLPFYAQCVVVLAKRRRVTLNKNEKGESHKLQVQYFWLNLARGALWVRSRKRRQ